MLEVNNKFLHKLAEALLVNETVDGEEFEIVHQCFLNDKKIEENIRNKQKEG
jgi:cell division protease FtsH